MFGFKDHQNILNFMKSDAFKIISADSNDSVVNEKCSLKNGITKYIIQEKLIPEIKSKPTSQEFIRLILNEEETENFFNSANFLSIIYKKYSKLNSKSTNKSIISTTLEQKEDYANLNENSASIIRGQSSDIILTTDENEEIRQESKVVMSIKNMFDKFDAAGDSFNIYHKHGNKTEFFEMFFSNLFVWGSYRIGNVYATDKSIIYRAVSKKLHLMNQKLNRILEQADIYIIKDTSLKESVTVILKAFTKIESFYNSIAFRNLQNGPKYGSESTRQINKLGSEENLEISVSMISDPSESEVYKNSQFSDYINSLNIGHLIPLHCGHNGSFSQSELEMYTLLLLNSKFLN